MRENDLRALLGVLLTGWLLAASPPAARAQTVVVDDTLWDFFNAPMNPGCGGCGLLDWDDLYNNGYACRQLPSGTKGASCTGDGTTQVPLWDDVRSVDGNVFIQGDVTNRFDGLVTEFDDPGDPFPPWTPATQGAIQSLTGTYSLRHTGHNGPVSNAFEGHLLIKQGSDFYVSDHFVSASSGGGLGPWVRVGESGGVPIVFTADDFDKVIAGAEPDDTQHPDFSTAGAALFFGFALDVSYEGPLGGPPGNMFLNRGFDVDDIEIAVTPVPSVPSATPLAGGLLGLLLAAAGVAAVRRRRASVPARS